MLRYAPIFTIVVLLAIGVIARQTQKSILREKVSDDIGENEVRQSIINSREDIKLIAFLLAAILLMLGIIADILYMRGP